MSSVNMASIPSLQAFRTAAGAGTDGYVKLGGKTGVKSTGSGFFQKLFGMPSGVESRRVREALFSAMSASTGDNMLLKLAIENVRNELGLGPASDPTIGNKPLSQRELKMILDNFDGAKAGTEAVMKNTEKKYVEVDPNTKMKTSKTYNDVMTQMRPELRKVYAEQYAYGDKERKAFDTKIDTCLAKSEGVLTEEAAELVLDEFKEWTNLIPGRLTASDLSKDSRDDLLVFEDQMRQSVEKLRGELKSGKKSPCAVVKELTDTFEEQGRKLHEIKKELATSEHGRVDQVADDVIGPLFDEFKSFRSDCIKKLDDWSEKEIKANVKMLFGATIDKLPTTNENKSIIRLALENAFVNQNCTLAQAKEKFNSAFWSNMIKGIKDVEHDRSRIVNGISNAFKKVLPAGIAKAMGVQFYDQILKFGLYNSFFDVNQKLLAYANQCLGEFEGLKAEAIQALCPMFNMQGKGNINSYLKNKIGSEFKRLHIENAASNGSTLNKVNHLTVREYHGAGTVMFDGEIPEADIKTVKIPDSLANQSTSRHNFYKFMSSKFDANHSGVSQLLTFCMSMANGIGGICQELFRSDESPESGKLRKGQEQPLLSMFADLNAIWDDGNPNTYEITTDRKKGEIVLVANVNLSPIPLVLSSKTAVGKAKAPFLHGPLKNIAQVKIRIKNTDDATLRKEKKKHPDFEVEFLSQKIADLNGQELHVNK